MKENQTLIKCTITAIISTFIMYLTSVSTFSPLVKQIFGSTNIPSMAISIASSLFLLFIFRKTKFKLPSLFITSGFSVLSLFLLISFIMERKIHAYEFLHSIESEISAFLLAIIVLLAGAFFALLCKQKPLWIYELNQKLRTKKGLFFILAVLILLIGISAYNQYNPNFLYRDEKAPGNPYFHLHAYTNSIFNLFWGQPFTETITSVYGHYGFFYYPLMKTAYKLGFHNLIKDFMFINMALVVCTLLNSICVLIRNSKNRFIQLLGITAICYFTSSRITPIYPQLYPHRTFCFSVMLLLLSLWYHSQKRQIVTAVGYFISVLMIIWSTECGIFSVITWAALHVCSIMQSKMTKKWFLIPVHFSLIPLCLITAVLFSGAMNVWMGGKMISLKDFLFPLLTKSYMHDLLEYPLSTFPSAWMSIMILLIAFLGYGVKDIVFYTSEAKRSDQSAVCFAAAVLGLTFFTYAINRPVYSNFFIILPLAPIFISIIADKYLKYLNAVFNKENLKSQKDLIKGCSALVCTFVLIILSVSSIVNIPYKLDDSAKYKDTSQIDEICKLIRSTGKEHTPGIGNPVALFYAYLGIDPEIYYMDTADFIIDDKFPEFLAESTKSLTDKSVFVSLELRFDFLPEEFLSSHTVNLISVNDNKIYFFEPIPNISE